MTLYVAPTRTSGRSSFSCIRMTFASVSCFSGSFAVSSRFSPSRTTEYLTIFLSILMVIASRLRRLSGAASELAVVAFLQRVEQVRGGVHLTVVLDLLVASRLDDRAVLEREAIRRAFQILLLHEHALERLGVEPERRAAFEPLLVRVEVDVLEILVRVIRRHVRRLRDRGVDPLLCRGLDVDVLLRRDVVGAHEVVRQLLRGIVRAGHRARVDELPISEQLEREDVDSLLRLPSFTNHVAEVVVRERGLDAVARVVRERQRDRAGRCDRAVMREPRALLLDLLDKLRRNLPQPLHVAAVTRVEHASRDLVADLVAVLDHL